MIKYKFPHVLLCFTLTLIFLNPAWILSSEKTDRLSTGPVTIHPQEYLRPLRNPHKGFTNRGSGENNEWATLMHSYIKWNEIERDSLDDIEQIKKWCDINWKGVENKNIKVIPRVYLHWDGDLTYWPEDMETFDYTSPQFIKRLVKMINKLGECWDTDPRIAHIEMGIIGKWGEHHSPSPSKEVEDILGKGFRDAFPHKKVLVRHPWEFTKYEFGIYWDSWAHQNQMSSHGQGIYDLGDRWKTEIIGGETAYNWGDWQIQPGDDPTDTMVDPVHRNFLIYTIRWLHCTQCRWVANYDQNNEQARSGAEQVQKVFGYRYVIDKVTYPSRIEKGDDFKVTFSGRNTGSAPFYYDWPVELSLLNESKNVVWSAIFDSVDIRKWEPGDKWLKAESRYSTPADTFVAQGTFKIDQNLDAGQYILALAVLDPSGLLPNLRCAIKNYFNGGRHPIGYTGVESDISSVELDSLIFDDPYKDKSLKYIYDPNLVGISKRKKKTSPQTSQLAQNYPNPFNPKTEIKYKLMHDSDVRLTIYNLAGQCIKTLVNEKKSAGSHLVFWHGKDDKGVSVASGLYFCTLIADNFSETRKIILTK